MSNHIWMNIMKNSRWIIILNYNKVVTTICIFDRFFSKSSLDDLFTVFNLENKTSLFFSKVREVVMTLICHRKSHRVILNLNVLDIH